MVPPSPASARLYVIVISPRMAGSAVSNSSTWTTSVSGTSRSKRPWSVSVCALLFPVPAPGEPLS